MSKILLWLVYKGLYSSFQYLVLYFPKEQIILTIVLVGFAVISENCIFLAVSQKGVSHYTVILLLIVSFWNHCFVMRYVIYMMITISKKSEKMQLYKLIELKSPGAGAATGGMEAFGREVYGSFDMIIRITA